MSQRQQEVSDQPAGMRCSKLSSPTSFSGRNNITCLVKSSLLRNSTFKVLEIKRWVVPEPWPQMESRKHAQAHVQWSLLAWEQLVEVREGASQRMPPRLAGNCSEALSYISQPLFFIPATQWKLLSLPESQAKCTHQVAFPDHPSAAAFTRHSLW